jgi:hypothetical protein
MALEAPGGFRFAWGSHPLSPVHLLPGDADPATGDVLCAIYPGWLPGLGRRVWHTDAYPPLGRALCGACLAKFKNLEKAGRLLSAPQVEQLSLFDD